MNGNEKRLDRLLRNVLAVARRLIRGNVIEDVDHRELYEAVRQVTA